MVDLARQQPGRYVTLFADEASFYRQPTQGWLWHQMGRRQPKLQYSHRSNTVMRVIGYMNSRSGAVHAWDYSKVTAVRFARSIKALANLYPDQENIYVVLDNWPVHFHPKVMQILAGESRVRLVPLPTYAPWLNPIEKLWKWCKQSLVHAHSWADDFQTFKSEVRNFLEPLSDGSDVLLKYAGLSR